MGTGGSFPGGKAAGAKKTWIYTSTPPYVFMEWCLISQSRGQFLHIKEPALANLLVNLPATEILTLPYLQVPPFLYTP
jgi:hypothetical protein